MRDKFSDLIKAGVASFNYTALTSDIPDTDPICRQYNNIFSIPSDTHMSMLEDGTRVITGHMINTGQWCEFCHSWHWGAVDFRTSGVWCLCEFLCKHGLEGILASLNGDVVYKIIPKTNDDVCPICPNNTYKNESLIPHQISELTNSGNKLHIIECFKQDIDTTIKNLNESIWVKGNNWVKAENHIIGLIGEDVYKINIIKNDD